MYEEDPAPKLSAAACIAALFQLEGGAHVAALLEHPTLPAALARLLREEFKRNSELALCLLACCLAIAQTRQGQALLVQVWRFVARGGGGGRGARPTACAPRGV